MVIGNGIDPAVTGHGMRLHPVSVIFALVVWGIVWGPIGMILAVPITAVIRLVLLEFESTRPMANLLAGEVDFDWTTGRPEKDLLTGD
jgi:AI-2 transport protein TqsA